MLQLAVTAHVEATDEVTLAGSRLLHGLIRRHSDPASLGRIGGYRFRGCQSAGMPVGQGRCTRIAGDQAGQLLDSALEEAFESIGQGLEPGKPWELWLSG